MEKPKIGSIGWYEHHSKNGDSAQAFYNQLMGWEMAVTDMDTHNDYTAMNGEDAVFGLIQKYPGLEEYTGWLPYFMVEDCKASLQKAVELGAKVIVDYEIAEGYGAFCVIQDPQGCLSALFQAE